MKIRYSVRQTDCRTGWQVVDMDGKILATYRRWDAAREHADELNSGKTTV